MPDSGQKTLPLMHKLKSLAGIVEPRRDTASERYTCMCRYTTIICMYIHVHICTKYKSDTELRELRDLESRGPDVASQA